MDWDIWSDGPWRAMDADLLAVRRQKDRVLAAFDWMEFFFLLGALFAAGCVLVGVGIGAGAASLPGGWPGRIAWLYGGLLAVEAAVCGCLVMVRYQVAACAFYGARRGIALTLMALLSVVGVFMLPRLLEAEVDQALRGEAPASDPPPPAWDEVA